MIVNAPAGATSAGLCNCSVTNNTAGPNSPISSNSNNNTNVNATTNNSINNNLNLASKSGDASVTNNTTAGNATSGNATASVNLLNLSLSNLSLANWFGILFINVFGTWDGSFGINTAAGNPTSTGNSSNIASSVKSVKVFGFIPNSGSNQNFHLVQLASVTNPNPSTNSSNTSNQAVILTGTTHNTPPATKAHTGSLFWTAGSLFFLGGVLAAEEAYNRRKETHAKLRKYIRGVTVQPLKRY
jgi:hypothetical protein